MLDKGEWERVRREVEYRNAHRGDASKRIRGYLDAALGQRPEAAKRFLREIVAIVEAGAAPPNWRQMVESEYRQLIPLLDWVSCHDVDGKPLEPSGRNSPLTEEQSKQITDYLPLVRSLALERASAINNLAGGTALDQALLAHLEDIGLRVLEEQVHRWDRNRGVTFGAFVTQRVAGAMDNYLTRERIKPASSGADAREMWKWEAHGARAKGNRTSTGGRSAKSYAETPKRHPSRLIKANPHASATELAGALAQLTPKERAVYEGRVLADPQVSLGEMAAQLKVSRPRIVALEKQARLRMDRLISKGK